MGEQRESTSTKWALVGEQSGGPLISQRSRVALSSAILYIYYIHPELRIANYPFSSGKGAGPLQREHWESTEGALGEHWGRIGGGSGEPEGAQGESGGACREQAGRALLLLPILERAQYHIDGLALGYSC